jgi:hypothetical protein
MTEATAGNTRDATGDIEWKRLPNLSWWAIQDFTHDNGPATNIFLYGGEIASGVQASMLEGKSREHIAKRHRLRSPVRKLENAISATNGRKDEDDKD